MSETRPPRQQNLHRIDDQIIERLSELNQLFYDSFAHHFSDTRGTQQIGLHRLLDFLPEQGSLLDVGCGNGRLALLLEQEERSIDYVGVDASEKLVAIAQGATRQLQHVHARFFVADLLKPGWTAALPAAVWPLRGASELGDPGNTFDAVTLLAVLHHVPGWHIRRNLLATVSRLMCPHGVLAVSTWQFLRSQRLRRKLVPWSVLDIDEQELEPGDYLLDWQRGGTGLRYCHLIDEDELAALAAAAGLVVTATYYADGRQGDLNLFAILSVREP